MNRKIDTESKIKTILEKVENKLRMIAKDPDVISYNYYNDSKFVGAKVMRNKKITLDELAAIVIEGFAEQKKFNELLLSLPTIKKEIEEAKNKK